MPSGWAGMGRVPAWYKTCLYCLMSTYCWRRDVLVSNNGFILYIVVQIAQIGVFLVLKHTLFFFFVNERMPSGRTGMVGVSVWYKACLYCWMSTYLLLENRCACLQQWVYFLQRCADCANWVFCYY